jgi:N-methylhydantoinase A/oxoprolinase/acetone carboxylase beta subunit
VPERLAATGEIVRPRNEAAALEIADRLSASGVEAVAVCLL